ncbi:MAG: hypothetical protein ACXWHJ_05470, partial [Candidatus Aminicenantales bacterium]
MPAATGMARDMELLEVDLGPKWRASVIGIKTGVGTTSPLSGTMTRRRGVSKIPLILGLDFAASISYLRK